MQILNQASGETPMPAAEEFERNEAGYNCLAQYVARAITLGVFAKGTANRQPAPPGKNRSRRLTSHFPHPEQARTRRLEG